MQDIEKYGDVREMNRTELLSFLYNYIKARTYVDEHEAAIINKIKANEQERAKELRIIDEQYEMFCLENLTYHETKAKDKLRNRQSSRGKKIKASQISTPRKIIIGLLILLIVAYISPLGFFNDIMEFIGIAIGFIIFIGVVTVVFPPILMLFIPIAGIGALFIKVIANISAGLMSFVSDMYVNISLGLARRKDRLSAKRKGITKENSKEVFQYDDIQSAINHKYDKLNSKIRVWNISKISDNRAMSQLLNKRIPLSDQKLEYIIYMYHQLEIGANDNWKEAINDLKLQLRHDELKAELRKISKSVATTNSRLIELNHTIDNEIRELNNMIYDENRRLNSRMDGMFDILSYSGYY